MPSIDTTHPPERKPMLHRRGVLGALAADAEILTAFGLWRDASSEVDETKLTDAKLNARAEAEHKYARKVASLPATTEAAALAKLALLIDYTYDNFQNDEDHPANLAIATLREAVEHLPVTVAQPIQFGLKGLRALADGYHAERSKARSSLATVKHAAELLSDLEDPVIKAEGVAETLFLLALQCGEAEGPVTYLANRLAEHLVELRTMWAASQALVQQAGDGKC